MDELTCKSEIEFLNKIYTKQSQANNLMLELEKSFTVIMVMWFLLIVCSISLGVFIFNGNSGAAYGVIFIFVFYTFFAYEDLMKLWKNKRSFFKLINELRSEYITYYSGLDIGIVDIILMASFTKHLSNKNGLSYNGFIFINYKDKDLFAAKMIYGGYDVNGGNKFYLTNEMPLSYHELLLNTHDIRFSTAGLKYKSWTSGKSHNLLDAYYKES